MSACLYMTTLMNEELSLNINMFVTDNANQLENCLCMSVCLSLKMNIKCLSLWMSYHNLDDKSSTHIKEDGVLI